MAKKSVKTNELSALRMPGFNAEASLYDSHATYRSSGRFGGMGGAVQPAILNLSGWVGYCVWLCRGDDLCLENCANVHSGGGSFSPHSGGGSLV
jgi:hypothetical protein